MVPTRRLLDKGFRLWQAADMLVTLDAIAPRERQAFMDAMKSRISRLKRKKIAIGGHSWMSSLYYDSTHLVQGPDRKALCGATATAWEAARSESNRCARCIGMGRKYAIVTV